jgi:hypothetical protein
MQISSSIRILYQLATKIKWFSEIELATFMNKDYLKQLKFNDDFYNKYPYPTSVSSISQDMIIIYTCSFLDEYDNVFTPAVFPSESKKIIELKNNVLPAYRQIKKWKDLKKIRNNIIAHNHRINGKSIFDLNEKIKYTIPSTNAEYTLLADLVFIIAENILPIFPELLDEIDFNKSLLDHLDIDSEKIDTFITYRKIKNEIEEIKKNKI